MTTYEKNPTGELLEDINEQYIEDNAHHLEAWFSENDDIRVMCSKDNIEEQFEKWLENQDYKDLVDIITYQKKLV